MRNRIKKLLFVLVALVMALGIAMSAQSAVVPIVSTDKADYSPGESVIITGSGFDANIELLVRVTRPDNSVITGDGSGLLAQILSRRIASETSTIATYWMVSRASIKWRY